MDIKRVMSPGGIEAWLVESHANPLIAMRFAFRGGAAQDPEAKQGLAYFVSGMMDEGAGELDSIGFQERLQTLAMRVDFDAGRDVMLGNVQMLTANMNESFDLLRLAMSQPRFDADALERVRAQIIAGLKFDENDPEEVASLAWDRLAFQGHPYGRPIKGTKASIAAMTATGSARLCPPRLRPRQARDLGGRRYRRRDARPQARRGVWPAAASLGARADRRRQAADRARPARSS